VITFTSFSEFNKAEGGDIWLAIDERRPLACITGIWTNWTPARKAKLPTTSSRSSQRIRTRKLSAIHPRATPVILTTPSEVKTWMTASSDETLKSQRPLLDGTPKFVARGVKKDGAEPSAT